MIELDDPAWRTRALAAVRSTDAPGHLEPCTVELHVTGLAGGELVGRWQVAGGRLEPADDGPAAAPPDGGPGRTDGGADRTVVVTVPAAEAAEILAGTLDPSVAFMRGRLKTSGGPGVVLELLGAAATGGWSTLRSTLTTPGEESSAVVAAP